MLAGNQDTSRVVIIKKHLFLPWARKQVYSSFLAQGKRRSFLIMNTLNVSWLETYPLTRVLAGKSFKRPFPPPLPPLPLEQVRFSSQFEFGA